MVQNNEHLTLQVNTCLKRRVKRSIQKCMWFTILKITKQFTPDMYTVQRNGHPTPDVCMSTYALFTPDTYRSVVLTLFPALCNVSSTVEYPSS